MKSAAACLGENLKRLRLQQGFTQENFAKKAKVSISFLQNIEKGTKWVGPKTIAALARTLRVPESELFRDCGRESATDLDAKQILLQLSRALGLPLEEAIVMKLKDRHPPAAYYPLYEAMPHEICIELIGLCTQPNWDWERFRARMRA